MTITLHPPGTTNPRKTLTVTLTGKPFALTFDTNAPTQRYICDILEAGAIYERDSTLAILAALKPGDVFFDVGANCGWFSAVSLSVGARVIAFEPDPFNVAALNINAPGATIIEAAVSETSGERQLFTNLDNDGGHSLWPCGAHPHNAETRTAGHPARTVRTVTLDDYAEHAPAVIKIDTEGAECNVLLGAEKLLANPALRLVVCERHDMGLALMQHTAAEVEDIMRRHGFTWAAVAGDGAVGNWIFAR